MVVGFWFQAGMKWVYILVGLCQRHKPQHPHHMKVSPQGLWLWECVHCCYRSGQFYQDVVMGVGPLLYWHVTEVCLWLYWHVAVRVGPLMDLHEMGMGLLLYWHVVMELGLLLYWHGSGFMIVLTCCCCTWSIAVLTWDWVCGYTHMWLCECMTVSKGGWMGRGGGISKGKVKTKIVTSKWYAGGYKENWVKGKLHSS